MAHIKPIRAWRYNRALSPRIGELTSPLFDVVSESQREALYQQPYNSIHLSVPRAGEGEVGELLRRWKHEKVLVQDDLPAVYVYYQHFSGPGGADEFVRKGFICHIKAYDWPERVILRHENTMPQSVNDRAALLTNTLLHVSPTHGLYTDADRSLERFMDEAVQNPIYETDDQAGVRDVLAVIHDAEAIRRFVAVLADKTIILADGHHRYEASLAYRRQQTDANPNHTGQEAYNYHLMYLTNTESNDLRILPTHRIAQGLPGFEPAAFLEALQKYFFTQAIEVATDSPGAIAGEKGAYGLVLKAGAYRMRLKPGLLATIAWKFPPAVKELDLTALHYFVFEQILGIAGREQRASPHIRYSRSLAECLEVVRGGQADCAFLTNEVSLEEVKRVSTSGYTMPPKSTYFYPKVICGLVFSSIQPDEFEAPSCSGF
ncbi:MAG: DUF1015 domain-containing protein [Ferruginibacter sp.]|nr:DUF1015 domain-containing protein [Cytophagales bacterium]